MGCEKVKQYENVADCTRCMFLFSIGRSVLRDLYVPVDRFSDTPFVSGRLPDDVFVFGPGSASFIINPPFPHPV